MPKSKCIVKAGKTALHRKKPSVPAKALEKAGLLQGRILDYGSGHGTDTKWLRSLGYTVDAWDPNHNPDPEPPDAGTYDTILCTYVLNTLPKHYESKIIKRIRANLTHNGAAYISVRADIHGEITTSKGTFQREVRLDQGPSWSRLQTIRTGNKTRTYILRKF